MENNFDPFKHRVIDPLYNKLTLSFYAAEEPLTNMQTTAIDPNDIKSSNLLPIKRDKRALDASSVEAQAQSHTKLFAADNVEFIPRPAH